MLRIPLDLSDIIDRHQEELPTDIIFESCESGPCCKELDKKSQDGEIFILNFIEEQITLKGSIRGIKDGEEKTLEFVLKPKENCSFFGFEYSDENQISINITASLTMGHDIPLISEKKIPLPTRSKQLIFYS